MVSEAKQVYWAHVISNVASPPVWMLGTAVLTMLAAPEPNAWVYLVAYAMPTILIPTFYIIYLYRTGKLSDLHVKKREERVKPMIVIAISAALSFFVLLFTSPPTIIAAVGLTMTAQFIGIALITIFWKVSLHTTSAATCVLMAYWVFPWLGLLLFPVLIAVIWARIKLTYHTYGQVAGGLLLGSSTLGTALIFLIL